MKQIFKGIGIIIIASLLYIGSFHLPFSIVKIYFYKGITNLIILSIILAICLLILKKQLKFDKKDIIIIILSFFSMHMIFFVTVPTTIERSISVFMLNEMTKEKNFSQEEIEKIFIKKYIKENKAFDKRLKEQTFSGLVKKQKDTYNINKKGEKMINLFKLINKIYNIKSQELK